MKYLSPRITPYRKLRSTWSQNFAKNLFPDVSLRMTRWSIHGLPVNLTKTSRAPGRNFMSKRLKTMRLNSGCDALSTWSSFARSPRTTSCQQGTRKLAQQTHAQALKETSRTTNKNCWWTIQTWLLSTISRLKAQKIWFRLQVPSPIWHQQATSPSFNSCKTPQVKTQALC